MIIPCMKLMSAAAGVRTGMIALSGERILLLCPGAPGCTMGAFSDAGPFVWPQAVIALMKSAMTEVTVKICRRPVIIIPFSPEHKTNLATRPGNDAEKSTCSLETWERQNRCRRSSTLQKIITMMQINRGAVNGQRLVASPSFLPRVLRQKFLLDRHPQPRSLRQAEESFFIDHRRILENRERIVVIPDWPVIENFQIWRIGPRCH